jgi:hypothetical protein
VSARPKLDWTYNNKLGVEVARYWDHVTIEAHQDSDAPNPFEDYDNHWPMVVYMGRDGMKRYPEGKRLLGAALDAISSAQLVHDQHAIARIFGWTVSELLEDVCDSELHDVKYCRDANALSVAVHEAWCNLAPSQELRVAYELYTLAGVPAHHTQVHGPCQGDWAELLIVATPEQVKAFGTEPEHIQASLEAQAKLYEAWAWGDCYGYIVKHRGVEIDDGSCWGYYGSDHHESGLEESALEAADWFIKSRRKVA